MKQTGAEIVISVLLEHQISTVFGYPGGQVLDLYEALYRHPEIHHILTAHEQGAAHAADGYARATGKVGVVIATSGPGATNLVTGIAAAHLDSTPLVAITGNVSLSLLGRDSFQEIDISGITMPITKHNYIVKEITSLASTLRQAFQIAASGRPGPVLVDIPKNIQQAVTDYVPQQPLPLLPARHPSSRALDQAACILQTAKRPFLYCGGGVTISNAGHTLFHLSRLIDAPIGCSMMGLSALPAGTHIGLMGMHGNQNGVIALSEADVILAAGMRFGERSTGNKTEFAPNASIIHIDIDPAEINKNIPADLASLAKKNNENTSTALLPHEPAVDHRTNSSNPSELLGCYRCGSTSNVGCPILSFVPTPFFFHFRRPRGHGLWYGSRNRRYDCYWKAGSAIYRGRQFWNESNRTCHSSQ